MNVEIRTEAAQFPEKEYINGVFVAVCSTECECARGAGCNRVKHNSWLDGLIKVN